MICLSEETDTMTEPSGEYLVGEHALATPHAYTHSTAATHLTQLV